MVRKFVCIKPIKDGPFWGCSRMGEGKNLSPSLKSVTNILHKYPTYPTFLRQHSFHSRTLNNKINRSYGRYLRIIYNDNISSSAELFSDN